MSIFRNVRRLRVVYNGRRGTLFLCRMKWGNVKYHRALAHIHPFWGLIGRGRRKLAHFRFVRRTLWVFGFARMVALSLRRVVPGYRQNRRLCYERFRVFYGANVSHLYRGRVSNGHFRGYQFTEYVYPNRCRAFFRSGVVQGYVYRGEVASFLRASYTVALR